MSVFYDLNKTPRNILNQAIVRAIVSENNGALFDPSDLSTLFQDAAGTTPVTAVEQPVGKMLDKSGNGYHATQSITASRPTLSARKNVLLATEALATQSVTTLAATYTLSFTGTGSATLSGAATGTLTGNGTDRVSLTFTPTSGTLTLTVSGSVTKAQIELGAVAGPYQRVNTATDYDTDERYFKKFLRFDGVDDYLNLPYMGLYANGSASVVVGLSTAVKGSSAFIVSEANNANDTTNYLLLIHKSRGVYSSSARSNNGVTQYSLTSSTISTGNPSNVVTVVDGGSGVNLFNNSIGIGAASYARSSATTLNTTTIGALDRLTDTGFIINNLYSLIITKYALTDAQRIKCERYAASKAGVQL